MRHFFFVLALFFGCVVPTAVITPHATAQSQANMNADLSKIGQWSQETNAFNYEVAAIFDSDEFNTLMGFINSGDFSSDAFKSTYSAWQVDYKTRIKKMREMEANFSPAPDIRTAELKPILSALVIQRESVPQMINDIQEMCVRLDNIIKRSAEGDLAGLDEVTDILIERAIKVIELENSSIEQIRLTLASSDHPNYHMLGMSISANNLAVEGLRITMGAETRKEREPYLRVMRDIITKAREEERRARSALEREKKRADAMQGMGGPSEQRLINVLIQLWNDFGVAIDNEAKIIDRFDQQVKIYERTETTTDLEAEILALDEEIFALIDIRLQLAERRSTLISALQ